MLISVTALSAGLLTVFKQSPKFFCDARNSMMLFLSWFCSVFLISYGEDEIYLFVLSFFCLPVPSKKP